MKFILLLPLLCALCACQTHRLRNTSQQDSSSVQTVISQEHVEKATLQSIQRNWQQGFAESAEVVILPAGPVSFHPIHGFEGEATAILTTHSQSEHTRALSGHTTGQRIAVASAQRNTSAKHTHAQEHESIMDRQPAANFSFKWLAFALLAGYLVLVGLRHYWKR